jgi:hypothetical protein
MISGDGQRLIQLGETAIRDNSNCAFVRTDIRRMREQDLREQRTLTPAEMELEKRKQIAAAYAAEWEQARQQKQRERAEKIRTGRIVLNKDGSETEQL